MPNKILPNQKKLFFVKIYYLVMKLRKIECSELRCILNHLAILHLYPTIFSFKYATPEKGKKQFLYFWCGDLKNANHLI